MENLNFNNKVYLGRKQIVLDCKFSLEQGREVDKVLSVQSCPMVLMARCEQGKVTFGGKLDTCFMYTTQVGENVCLVNVSEFMQTYENSAIQEGDTAIVECKIVDITTPTIKTNEVKVACIVDASVSVVKSLVVEQNFNEQDYITKTKQIEVLNLSENVSENFDINEQIKVPDGVSKVLKVQADLSLNSAYCASGFLSLDFNALVNVVYVDDDGALKVHKCILPIKQEVECNASTVESKLCLNIFALNYLTKTVVTQGDGFNIVKVQIPVQVVGQIFTPKQIDVVLDAYSTLHIVEVQTAKVCALVGCENMQFEGSARGEVQVKEQNASSPCVLSCNTEVTNCSFSAGKLIVEGVVSATIAYTEQIQNVKPSEEDVAQEESSVIVDDKQVATASVPVRVDYGFSFSFDAPNIVEGDDVECCCKPADLECALTSGQALIDCTLHFWVNVTKQKDFCFVESIKPVTKRQEKTCAMEIFVSEKEQDLWALCKQIGLEKQDVLKQNPNVQDVVKKGERIFIYYKLNAE